MTLNTTEQVEQQSNSIQDKEDNMRADTSATTASAANENAQNTQNQNNNNNSDQNNNNMGLASKYRNGSIQNCRKNATVHKRRQSSYVKIGRGGMIQSSIVPWEKRAFMAIRDCEMCEAYHLRRFNPSIRIPHRKHHKLCSKNTSTKGHLSDRSIEVLEFSSRMEAQNQRPLASDGIVGFRPTNGDLQNFLRPRTSTSTAAANSMNNTQQQVESQTPLASDLRARVDQIVVELGGQPSVRNVLVALAKEVFASMKVKRSRDSSSSQMTTQNYKEKELEYRKYFAPGEILCKIPKEVSSQAPSPYYHALEGCAIADVDWERSHPGTKLYCLQCKDETLLQRVYTNLSKNNSLLNILTFTSTCLHIVARVMQYKCPGCKKIWSGADGELLMQLPPHIREAYPVSPEYAIGKNTTFHMQSVQFLT